MPADYDKILFSTQYPIDKVVQSDTVSFFVPFTTTAFYNNSGTMQTDRAVNNYGKPCLIRFAWSVDGVNYTNPETVLEYSFNIDAHIIGGPSSNLVNGVAAAASMSCDATGVQFYSYNGSHGNVTYTAGNDSYSGINHTFYFKYALFELD